MKKLVPECSRACADGTRGKDDTVVDYFRHTDVTFGR